jgi:prepilin-type N-terminal cleavage/methylation domain-containing protein
MRASRQGSFLPAARRAFLCSCRGGGRAFTLIELIFVLVLLAICAVFVTASMGSFFRGRVLNFEARRMLSLTHYGQSRAISEGVPVILWINPTDSTYGLSVQSSFNDPAGDVHAVTYTTDPSLTLETPAGVVAPVSEQDDEKLGVTVDGLAFIRFTPDGFFDESSITKIAIHQGAEGALELVPTVNRLGYEIRPFSNVD